MCVYVSIYIYRTIVANGPVSLECEVTPSAPFYLSNLLVSSGLCLCKNSRPIDISFVFRLELSELVAGSLCGNISTLVKYKPL